MNNAINPLDVLNERKECLEADVTEREKIVNDLKYNLQVAEANLEGFVDKLDRVISQIFEMSQLYRDIEVLLIESEGEVTPQIQSLLNMQFAANPESTVESMLNLAAEARARGELLDAQVDRWKAESKVEKARAEKLVGLVDSFMVDTKRDKLTAGVYQLKFKKLPASIAVGEVNLKTVAPEFVRVTVTTELNKVDLLKAWKVKGDEILPAGITVNTTGKKLAGYTIKGVK